MIFIMAAQETVSLKPTGDVELWFAQADDCTWRLPLHVEWKEDQRTGKKYGLVLPGVCFYHVQNLAIQSVLGPHSLEQWPSKWLLPQNVLEAVLHKAPGIHATFYYLWPNGTHPPLPSPHHPLNLPTPAAPVPRRSEQYRSFAEFVAKERGLPADVVLVVLTAVAQVGARWLLDRQSIDLGFVKLVALPFRVNWKEIISFKCRPWKLSNIMGRRKADRRVILDQLGFPGIACSPHNIGLPNRPGAFLRRLDYTIEAIPHQSFEAAVEVAEKERMRLGRTGYVAQYEDAVEKLYDNIIDSLAHYTRKVHSAWATVREVRCSGVLSFLPVSRHAVKVRGVPLSKLPVHLCPPDSDFSVLAEKKGASDPGLVQAQDAEVLKMSALPPADDDVRERPGYTDLDESRSIGAVGLPVLDAGEGTGSG